MKQIGIVFKFEFLGYAKRRYFIILTLLLMVVVAVILSWPRLSSGFSRADDSQQGAPVEASQAVEVALAAIDGDAQAAAEYYNTAMHGVGYRFVSVDLDRQSLEQQVDAGIYDSAILLTDPLQYVRFVRNTDLYDSFSSLFNEMMLGRYRADMLAELGVPVDEAAQLLSANVQAETVTTASGKDGAQNFLYTYILIMLLYFTIIMYGNMVSSNVANEKTTRAMELLITSAKPSSLMFGKVLGAGVAGLAQFILIIGTAFAFYQLNAEYFVGNYLVQSIFAMPLSLLLYSVLFYVLGFFIYAFLYAALASLVSRMEDLSQAILPMTFVLIIAFMVVVFSISSGSVNNVAMVVCSYIPLTSPMAMFARVAMGDVAGWEIAISVAVLLVSTVGVGYLASAIYRLGVLLYGNPPKPAEIVKMLRANKAAKKGMSVG